MNGFVSSARHAIPDSATHPSTGRRRLAGACGLPACGPRSTGEFLLDMLAFRRATNGFLFANRPVRGQSISQDVDILCTAKIGSANHLHAKILPFIHNNFWTHSEVMLGPQARLRSQEDSFFFLKR